MAKVKTLYRCEACDATAPQWAGRCAACGDWNTLVEQLTSPTGGNLSAVKDVSPVSINHAFGEISVTYPTRLSEVDRVLGGGLVPGSVTLLGGEPGIGKSTLVLQLCDGLASGGLKCLVVTGEESAEQVARRAQRLGITNESVSLLAESDVATILAVLDRTRPDVLIVDSVQTMSTTGLGGSVSQVREVAQTFTSFAKANRVATVLIGHVTKEGALAGPRVLEHVVDTVLEFEGDRHQGLRFLRAVKHRFGATDEVGVLTMAGAGLESVADASGLFLDDRRPGISGSIVVPVLQGRRPLLAELQALVQENQSPNGQIPPRRVAQGIDSGRLALLVAVLNKRAGVSIGGFDIFVSAVGGVRIDDPGADLALALALVSSGRDLPLPEDLIAIGEVGLGGEVRKVPQIDKRLGEASRMGFKRAFVPKGSNVNIPGMQITQIDDLRAAFKELAHYETKGFKPAIVPGRE